LLTNIITSKKSTMASSGPSHAGLASPAGKLAASQTAPAAFEKEQENFPEVARNSNESSGSAETDFTSLTEIKIKPNRVI
jgi:hypothetical protein